MAGEQICIHTPQGMVCYRNSAHMVGTKVEVSFDIYCTTLESPASSPLNGNEKLHGVIESDTGREKVALLFRTAKEHKDIARKLKDRGVDVDEWHTITRIHQP